MIGGLLNSYLLTKMGWQAIFYIGGVVPLVIAVLLFFYLPESIKFLLTRRNDTAAIRKIVARFRSPLVREDSHFVIEEKQLPGAPIRHLFSEGRALGTLLLWVPFFMGFWRAHGSDAVDPGVVAAQRHLAGQHRLCIAFNGLGAFIGQSTAGRLMERFGILLVLFPAFLLGTAATIGLGYGASSVVLAATFIGLVGLFMGLGTAGAIALSALIYPRQFVPPELVGAWPWAGSARLSVRLIAGSLLGAGWTADKIMIVIACAGLIAAVFVVLFRLWYVTRGGDLQSGGGSVRQVAEFPAMTQIGARIRCSASTSLKSAEILRRQHGAADDAAGAQIVEGRLGLRRAGGRG